ncbi:MAG: N-acyl-D-amino-acid deacylase [Parcubacteria group bacterium Gr01-1014_66]|nr:MAG: N-acyl-D-amino-acid deacylase [Parcubacteria group bacterium Gr01-1014_66]
MAYDILIKGGIILDGKGGEPYPADVAIADGEIKAIDQIETGARKTINAGGKYVAPGFIDVTNHSDTHLLLFRYPLQESMIMQGVTTIVGGNCGASLAPLASSYAIHAIDKWADPSVINVNWNTVAEFFENLKTLGLSVNFASMAGYSTLKRGIIGDEVRELSQDERERLKYLIRESVAQGARGISFGLSYGHERVSSTEELVEIARVLQGTGALIKVHLRSEGADVLGALNEVIRIGREAEVPVAIGHFKVIGKKSWPLAARALEMIHAARESGVAIHFDVTPYATTGSLLYLLIAPWARRGGFRELFRRMGERTERVKIIEELTRLTLHYDKMLITGAKVKNVVGKTIQEIAEEGGISHEEAVLQLVRSCEGRVAIVGKTVSWKNVQQAVKNDASIIATDGEGYGMKEMQSGDLVHPRSFGTFPHFWHRFVRDLKVFKPEYAIQKMTSLPARFYNIPKRGVLERGNVADIVIFDQKEIHDAANYRNPFQFPAGIEWVLVRGMIAVAEKAHTGIRSGVIIGT